MCVVYLIYLVLQNIRNLKTINSDCFANIIKSEFKKY